MPKNRNIGNQYEKKYYMDEGFMEILEYDIFIVDLI